MLEGKRVLVTGASRGIGRGIALACAKAGATVGVGCHRSEAAGHDVCRAIEKEHGRPAFLARFDVSAPLEVEEGIARFAEQAGGLDALVNNAGCFEGGLLATQPIDAIDHLLSVNLAGVIYCARAVLPRFVEQHSGIILNLGSVASVRPNQGQAVYAATKSAVEGLTRALAMEYARKGIRVLCLSPGPIDTDMLSSTRALAGDRVERRIPLGRLGTAEEVARFAVFLLSDQMAFASGSIHAFDGGYLVG
jgi:3-oxoacyl-[acyl-carrier protein] reductase